jgi:hypothetical protein
MPTLVFFVFFLAGFKGAPTQQSYGDFPALLMAEDLHVLFQA